MLDLTLHNIELYEIKWLDGSVLKLKAPSQRLYREIQAMEKIQNEADIIESVYETTREVINNNTQKIVVDQDDIDALSIDTCLLVITDYFQYYSKAMADNVVFQKSQQTNQ